MANVVMPAVVVPMASADVVLVKPIVAVDVRGPVDVGAPVDDDVVAVVDVEELPATANVVAAASCASAQQRTEYTGAVSSAQRLPLLPKPSPDGTRCPRLHAELVQICFQSRAQPVPDDALRRISSYVHRRAPTDPHSDNASL